MESTKMQVKPEDIEDCKIHITNDEWTDIRNVVHSAILSDGKVFCSTLRSVCKGFEVFPPSVYWISEDSFQIESRFCSGCEFGYVLKVAQPKISPEYEGLKNKIELVGESLKRLKTTGLNFDPVSKPAHYTEGRKYEPRKVIHDWELNFNLGNAVKYISRAGRKENAIEDLKKAIQYIKFELEELENADS